MGGSGVSTRTPLGGPNSIAQKPFGNNGSGVSWQSPGGGPNSFVNNPTAGNSTMPGFGPNSEFNKGFNFGPNNFFNQGYKPFIPHQFAMSSGPSASYGAGDFLAHGFGAGQHAADQNAQAQNQANTAGLMGSQYGNSLGGGGMSQHFSNMGYNQQLAQFAQMMASQNQQAQGQALQSLMAMLSAGAMFT